MTARSTPYDKFLLGGRFYFLEHIAAKPWTFQYFLQHLVTKFHIWPSLFNGCCCNQNTLSDIQNGGFKWVQYEKIFANCSHEMFSAPNNTYSIIWQARVILYFVNIWLVGLAEKGQFSEEKKRCDRKSSFERKGRKQRGRSITAKEEIKNI